MKVVVLIIFYLIFISVEVFNFVGENKKKELYVYSVFMLLSFIISLLLVLGVNVPSYDKFVGEVVFKIFGKPKGW